MPKDQAMSLRETSTVPEMKVWARDVLGLSDAKIAGALYAATIRR